MSIQQNFEANIDYNTIPAVLQPGLDNPAVILPENQFFRAEYDSETAAVWLSLNADCKPKFTPELVRAFRNFQRNFKHRYFDRNTAGESQTNPQYLVLASDIPNTFNLGGDLSYFYELITTGDRERLTRYATNCTELIYQNHVAMDLPLTTIALVSGDALGGGMEAAISANVLIAERQVTMGLPEVLFNMFPGMGAYQFLSQHVSPADAEKMILSGRTWSAEELYEKGIVDVLAEPGRGKQAVDSYISRNRRTAHASRGLRRAIRGSSSITREELMSVVDAWVDTAMSLDQKDLARMQYLIRAQQKQGF